MPYVNKRTLRKLCGVGILMVVLLIVRPLTWSIGALDKLFHVGMNFIYIYLLLFWHSTLRERVIHPKARRLLCTAAILLAFWMVLRLMKYQNAWPENEAFVLLIWYSYYIPIIWGTLFCFFASLYIGKNETEKLSPYWRLLIFPAAFFSVAVLTNNYTQLVFRFDTVPFSEKHYHWGPVWYLTIGFCLSLFMFGLLINYRKFRNSGNRNMIWIPIVFSMIPLILIGLESIGIQKVYKMPEMMALYVFIWMEACIEIGYIPVNSSYRDFFEESELPIFITDYKGEIRFSSDDTLVLTEDMVREARKGSVMISETKRLSSQKIKGGYVLWVEDLEEVINQNEELNGIRTQLSEEVELIRAENEIQKRKISIQQKEILYNKISGFTQPYVLEIEEKIAAKDFGYACFLTSYMKRRTNLMILLEDEETIPAEEMGNCIRELSLYTKYIGIVMEYNNAGDGAIKRETAFHIFDTLLKKIREWEGTGDVVKVSLVCEDEDANLSLCLLKKGCEQPVCEEVVE